MRCICRCLSEEREARSASEAEKRRELMSANDDILESHHRWLYLTQV